jgi:hypothetical protein
VRYNLVVDQTGNAFVFGRFHAIMDAATAEPTSIDDADFVVFAADGTYLWSADFAATPGVRIWDIAAGPSEGVVIVGQFCDAVDLGGGPLQSHLGSDLVVARLSLQGEHVWSQQLPHGGTDTQVDLAIGTDDSVVLTGTFVQLEVDGEAVVTKGPSDMFLMRFTP